MKSQRHVTFAVSIGAGELIDRLAIALIKHQKGLPVDKDLHDLVAVSNPLEEIIGFSYFKSILISINESLWQLEDFKRKSGERYTDEYSDVGMLIAQLNDLRHLTKKRADIYFDSPISEVKSHSFD